MFLLKKILTALVLPPFGLVLLCALGLWISRHRPKLGHSISLFALLLLTVLSLPYVSGSMLRTLEQHGPITTNSLSRAKAIVILAGGNYANAPEYGGDTVNTATLERIRYGIHLQKKTQLPILVTGGAPFGGNPEAEIMAVSIREDFGASVRWIESKSRDTSENAEFSAAILKQFGITHIALVSQAWHLPRAITHFENAGLKVLPAPTGFNAEPEISLEQFLPQASALSASSRAIQEWLGVFIQFSVSGLRHLLVPS
jgi:uncharacterized SAM-binding protein YcdF (DUF218 family)